MFENLSEQEIDTQLVDNGLMTMDEYTTKWYGVDRLGWTVTLEQHGNTVE